MTETLIMLGPVDTFNWTILVCFMYQQYHYLAYIFLFYLILQVILLLHFLFCLCADINHSIPQHTLQLEISGIESLIRVGEEDEEEEEIVVLDPEHVCKPNLFFSSKAVHFHICNTFSDAPCSFLYSLAFNEKIPVYIEKNPQ